MLNNWNLPVLVWVYCSPGTRSSIALKSDHCFPSILLCCSIQHRILSDYGCANLIFIHMPHTRNYWPLELKPVENGGLWGSSCWKVVDCLLYGICWVKWGHSRSCCRFLKGLLDLPLQSGTSRALDVKVLWSARKVITGSRREGSLTVPEPRCITLITRRRARLITLPGPPLPP